MVRQAMIFINWLAKSEILFHVFINSWSSSFPIHAPFPCPGGKYQRHSDHKFIITTICLWQVKILDTYCGVSFICYALTQPSYAKADKTILHKVFIGNSIISAHAYNQPDPQTVLHRKRKHGRCEKAYRIPLLSYYQVIAITGVRETMNVVLVGSVM